MGFRTRARRTRTRGTQRQEEAGAATRACASPTFYDSCRGIVPGLVHSFESSCETVIFEGAERDGVSHEGTKDTKKGTQRQKEAGAATQARASPTFYDGCRGIVSGLIHSFVSSSLRVKPSSSKGQRGMGFRTKARRTRRRELRGKRRLEQRREHALRRRSTYGCRGIVLRPYSILRVFV